MMCDICSEGGQVLGPTFDYTHRLLDPDLAEGGPVAEPPRRECEPEAMPRVSDLLGQEGLIEAFKAGELTGDVIAVVRFSGPKALGMPELHKLTPILGVLQDRGHRVALVTDGRMSGASGKVPSAIHVSPEALDGGPLARLHDGDVVRVDVATDGSSLALTSEGKPAPEIDDIDDDEVIEAILEE